MKKVLLPIVAIALLATASCKKCYVCSNECQSCTVQNVPLELCSADFPDPNTYQTAILGIQAAGGTCIPNSGNEQEICDDKTTADNFKKLFEEQGLVCRDK